jgi:Co/Zn/Cd efflux system component
VRTDLGVAAFTGARHREFNVHPIRQRVVRALSPERQDFAMSSECCAPTPKDEHRGSTSYRRALWAVLAINVTMFAVEIGAGLAAGSASLQADALDFLGDAGNYAISLFVVGMALRYRAAAAMLKGATMAAFGLWVIGITFWHALDGTVPGAFTMGAVGVTALAANAASFGILWAHRAGDANMRSAWICTRNDVLGNLAVLVAAAGVFGTGTGWPDVIVAAVMASLALQGAATVLHHAREELRAPVLTGTGGVTVVSTLPSRSGAHRPSVRR